MKIAIGIPIINQHKLTVEFLDLIFKNTNQIDNIIIVDNGSQPHILEYIYQTRYDYFRSNKINVIRNIHNVGVKDALNQIYQMCHNDLICYSHNDVLFNEKGWDDKIRETFKKHPEAGIVGAYGAKGLGTFDIYQTPYQQNQLARQIPVSNCPMDKKVHGFRNMENDFENVAVFDGFFMVVRKELLNKTEGFSRKILLQHHQYDHYICVESLKNGYENILIPLNLFHLGGRSDVGEDWTKGWGKSKQDIHTESHPLFYEYGKGILPIFIEDIYDQEGKKIIGYNLFMNRELVKTKMYE